LVDCRCAILLEELFLRKAQARTAQTAPHPVTAVTAQDGIDGRADLSGAGGQVVVELKTLNALPLIKFACKPYRTLPLPTGQLNAQRVSQCHWCAGACHACKRIRDLLQLL
jgi:hypothetical protein